LTLNKKNLIFVYQLKENKMTDRICYINHRIKITENMIISVKFQLEVADRFTDENEMNCLILEQVLRKMSLLTNYNIVKLNAMFNKKNFQTCVVYLTDLFKYYLSGMNDKDTDSIFRYLKRKNDILDAVKLIDFNNVLNR
jgi:hypothetical protein